MANICKHCGNELPSIAKFCAKCGTPTSATESAPPAFGPWTCPSCGHENKKGIFCAKCGAKKPSEVLAAPAEISAPEQSESNALLTPPPPPMDTPVAGPSSQENPQSDSANPIIAATNISANGWICPVCGHETQKGIFCAKCGGKKPQGDTSTIEKPLSPSVNLTETEANTEQSATTPSLTLPASPMADNQQSDIVSTAFYNLGIACRRIHDAIGDAMPTSASISDISAKLHNNKAVLVCSLIAILTVLAYFGSNKLTDSLYASKAEECAAILTESKSLLDNLAEIPGDAASDDVKKVAEGLAKNADKLNSIRSGIIGKLPRNPQQEKTWNAIEKNAEMLSKAAAMVRSEERAFAPMSIKRFSALCDECMAKWDEANMASTYATVKNQPLSDLIPYADIKKDLQTYRRNKQAFDAKHAQEKNNEELKKHQEQNNKLKKMPEVVFLADNAYKNGNDLILSGRFYNGTGDLVTSIMDMQIDLKVSLFGTEVQSLKDEPFSLQLSGLRLMPRQTTDVVQLRLPGKAPEEDFNEFEEHVHKIRWSRMKAR